MEHFIEIQHWGWNALSITATLNVVFALIRARGVVFLITEVWHARATSQVEVPLYMLICIVGLVMLPYGYVRGELVLMINGALLIATALPIIAGAWRFGNTHVATFALFVFTCLATVGAWYMPLTLLATAFLVTNVITFIPMVRQGWRLWQYQDVGVIPVQMLWWILAGSGLWFMYGQLVGDAPVSALAIAQIVIVGATIAIWYRVRAAHVAA